MAAIELRNATLRVKDGSTGTAELNGSPVNGDTAFDIDTVTGDVAVGSRFTVVGNDENHYVTVVRADDIQQLTVDATSGNYTLGFTGTTASPIAVETTANIAFDAAASAVQSALEGLSSIVPGDVVVTGSPGGPYLIRFAGTYAGVAMEDLDPTDVDLMGGGDTVAILGINTGGDPERITFTPALLTANGIPVDNANVVFLGRTLEVKIGDGNLTYTENRDLEYRLDRGNLDTVRELDQQPMDVTMDFIWEFITAPGSSDIPTLEDALKQRGVAADWVSSSDDQCEPYAVDIEIEYQPPCSNEDWERITLPDFRWDTIDHNLTDATLTATGRCNATQAIVERITAPA